MRYRMTGVALLCLALGISAQAWAEQLKDLHGTVIGERVWTEVAADRATVQLPPKLFVSKHVASSSIANRYHERITLVGGGYLSYEYLVRGLNTARGITAQAAQVHDADKSLKRLGMHFVPGDFQVATLGGRSTARAVKSGDSRRCIVFYAWFGQARGMRNDADQSLSGGMCTNAGTSTDADMLAEWDRYLAEIRIVSGR